MNRLILPSSLVLAAMITSAGCKSGGSPEGPPSSPAPATQPAPIAPSSGNTATPGLPAVTNGVPTGVEVVKEADMTHKVTAEAGYYNSMPAKDQAPDGKLKAGTKVLVMNPGTTYSQAKKADGSTVYLKTEELEPIGK